MIFFVWAFAIVLMVFSGITFLFYFVPKKLGYPKLGKILASIVAGIFVSATLWIVFEDKLISKGDANEFRSEQNMTLKDNCEIVNNESMTSVGDYYHTFTLKISDRDKSDIINEIKNSDNFKQKEPEMSDNEKYDANYETSTQFIREIYIPNGEGYAPTHRIIK